MAPSSLVLILPMPMLSLHVPMILLMLLMLLMQVHQLGRGGRLRAQCRLQRNRLHRCRVRTCLSCCRSAVRYHTYSPNRPLSESLASSTNVGLVRVDVSSARYAPGCAVGGTDTSGFATAVAAASGADVDAVVFVGGDSGGLGWNQVSSLSSCSSVSRDRLVIISSSVGWFVERGGREEQGR